jgi:C4-dicarboxylate-specific signal transduction histidine kinase
MPKKEINKIYIDAAQQNMLVKIDFLLEINKCETVDELNNLLNSILSSDYQIIESLILSITELNYKESVLFGQNVVKSDLMNRIEYLIEEGIIEWVLQSGEPQLIMDLQSQLRGGLTNILLIPFIRKNTTVGMLVAFTEKQKEDFNESSKYQLNILSSFVAEKLFQISIAFDKQKLDLKLQEQNKRFIQSLPLTTLGEISVTIIKETLLPLQIINSNVELIESGVGNVSRRLEIIKQQLNSISEIIGVLDEISENSTNTKIEVINTLDLIYEVKSIISAQLKSKGVILEISYDNDYLLINGVKSQLDYVLIQLIMFLSSTTFDNKKIYLSLTVVNQKTLMIAIKDEGIGFEAENYEELIDVIKKNSQFERFLPTLYSIKSIMKNNHGKIDCQSSINSGTIFRIYFPYYEIEVSKSDKV